jgi:hypothetical protein
VTAHHRHLAVGVEPDDRGDLAAQERAGLLGHRIEDTVRTDTARDEHRDPPQRRLLAGETAQVGLGLPARGQVAGDAVHDAVLDDGSRRPLEGPERAVLADVAVRERQRGLAAADRVGLGGRPRAVVRMDEIHVRLGEELLRRVAEDLLDGRVDAREAAVEAGHRHEIRADREDAVEQPLRAGAPRRVEPERAGRGGDDYEAGGEHEPGPKGGAGAEEPRNDECGDERHECDLSARHNLSLRRPGPLCCVQAIWERGSRPGGRSSCPTVAPDQLCLRRARRGADDHAERDEVALRHVR